MKNREELAGEKMWSEENNVGKIKGGGVWSEEGGRKGYKNKK
jgi:hypothetical protein